MKREEIIAIYNQGPDAVIELVHQWRLIMIENTFNNFPKKRPELPNEYKAIYEKNYEENRNGKTKMSALSQMMEGWLHRKVAKSSSSDKNTLELGAGTLNQLKYEKVSEYDIVEPFETLYKNSPELHRIRKIYDDIYEIPETEKYDRIISCACFEHIINLPEVVASTCKLLTLRGGIMCASIPNQGRLLWKMGYTFTTGREFKKRYGLSYDILMNHEHVNTADEIEEILKYFYKKVKMKLFGINKTFALYRYYECTHPDIKKAEEYLSNIKK
ncbi:MAG: class I SAM-dependent methyltransferase [Spirochaetia bacterium]|jgi:hypothetical protein|nr:class I SAM-dependent methyltransferase [Spirochaetia bacterium]